MFGNGLAVLSLLLLSLSNLSNLSEAFTRRQLRRMLLEATESYEIQYLLEELGEGYYKYADLININVEKCTPERILFDTNVAHMIGQGAKDYVTRLVDTLRQFCEDTFVWRLKIQYGKFKENWNEKEYFEQFIDFVDPWSTLQTTPAQIDSYIEDNVQKFLKWRQSQLKDFGARNKKVGSSRGWRLSCRTSRASCPHNGLGRC